MNKESLEKEVKNKNLIKLHTAFHKGYISRKGQGIVKEYAGIYGTGYKLLEPNWKSNNLCFITYYIKKNELKRTFKPKKPKKEFLNRFIT